MTRYRLKDKQTGAWWPDCPPFKTATECAIWGLHHGVPATYWPEHWSGE